MEGRVVLRHEWLVPVECRVDPSLKPTSRPPFRPPLECTGEGGRRPGGSGSPSGRGLRLSNICLLHNLSRCRTCRRRASRRPASLSAALLPFVWSVSAALRRPAASPGSRRGRVRCGASPVSVRAKNSPLHRSHSGRFLAVEGELGRAACAVSRVGAGAARDVTSPVAAAPFPRPALRTIGRHAPFGE